MSHVVALITGTIFCRPPLKGVAVSLHLLELPVSSFSPSRFRAVAGNEPLCNALFAQ